MPARYSGIGQGIALEAAAEVRALRERDEASYVQVFLRGSWSAECPVPVNLAEMGMLETKSGRWRSRLMLTCLDATVIPTDFPFQVASDQVFPVFEDESALLGRLIAGLTGDLAVDLYSGSGVLAYSAAAGFARVVATEISSRALAFSSTCAAMNGLSQKVGTVQCDGATAVRLDGASLVIANPPFVPHPDGVRLPLFSGGGWDGLRELRRVLNALRAAKGWQRALVLAICPGRSGVSAFAAAAEAAFGGTRAFRTEAIYPAAPLSWVAAWCRNSELHEQWLNELQKQGFDTMHYEVAYLGEWGPQGAQRPGQGGAWPEYSGSWRGRMRRWELWRAQQA